MRGEDEANVLLAEAMFTDVPLETSLELLKGDGVDVVVDLVFSTTF